MSMPSRPVSRLELLDARNYEPKLRMSEFLGVPPSEAAAVDRSGAQRTWQALQATPEEVAQDRAELEKMDRAVLAIRKQVHAARADTQATRAQLARVQQESYPAAAVWGLGLLAALASGAWIFERRRVLASQDGPLSSSLFTVPARPPAPPPAGSEGTWEFDRTHQGVGRDEADELIERARVAAAKSR
jgi:hypothetical protein